METVGDAVECTPSGHERAIFESNLNSKIKQRKRVIRKELPPNLLKAEDKENFMQSKLKKKPQDSKVDGKGTQGPRG